MKKSEKEINDIKKTYKHQIDRIDKMLLNMYAVSNIRYWYSCLSNIPVTDDKFRDFMLIDTFTTCIVVSYGRLFGETNGTIVLNKNIIPKELLPVHDQIISLRNERYAHHGQHDTMEKNIDVKYIDSSFVITPELQVTICMGAPKEWAPLFKWLDEYLYNTLHKTLDFLTKATGTEWKIIHGSVPPWVE